MGATVKMTPCRPLLCPFKETMKNIAHYEEAKRLLDYDPETGELTWNENATPRRRGHKVRSADTRGYYRATITVEGKAKTLRAHRIIMFMVHGEILEVVDHIDRDTSNNRLSNLRLASQYENSLNREVAATSLYKGVHLHKESGKWCAQIRNHGKVTHLGLFIDEIDAAKAYAAAAREHHGEFANPNFK